MKIVIDSREHRPFSFSGEHYEGVVVSKGTLPTGDYSLAGLADKVAIERKELADLVQCLGGKERERFTRELARARGLDMFAVVVESTWQDLAQGQYRSAFKPHAACQYYEGEKKRLCAILKAYDASCDKNAARQAKKGRKPWEKWGEVEDDTIGNAS